jgi:hypothetical protein
VLYWLSPADLRRIAIIDASPSTISLRRAFLVRVMFPPVPTG